MVFSDTPEVMSKIIDNNFIPVTTAKNAHTD